MEQVGYKTVLKMQRDDGGVNDLIFQKRLYNVGYNTVLKMKRADGGGK